MSHVQFAPAVADDIRLAQKMLIGGEWVGALSGRTLPVYDPADGRLIVEVPDGDAADVDRAVAAARAAFAPAGRWRSMTPQERGKLIWRLADLVEQNAERLATLDSIDSGKPINEMIFFDIPFTVDVLRYYAGWPTKITGDTIPISYPARLGAKFHAYTLKEPVGVVGAIVPWNLPLLMAVKKLAPALATGCTIVLKPAEQTPISMALLAQLTIEAGFPPGVINYVTGLGETAGAAIASHGGIAKVTFTGRGTDPATQMGPLISAEHRDKVLGYVAIGLAEGAQAVTGGHAVAGEGYFAEPTVLVNAKPDSRIMQEEIFDPVVCAAVFDTEDEVLALANNTRFGLGAAVWTRDISRAHRMAAAIESGQVWVNCYQAADSALPFGGTKESGWGRETCRETLEEYLETKTVVVSL
jgi:acyl-CoA reductase-like NAD-dependent aldehyde dehydrogenase